jgi:hypothetical protein
VGEREVITGVAIAADKVRVATTLLPPGEGLITKTLKVPALACSVTVNWNVIWVELMKAVVWTVPPNCT